MSKPTFAIICRYTRDYFPVARVTVEQNKMEYAHRHSYKFLKRVGEVDLHWRGCVHGNGISWDRLAYLWTMMLRYPEVDWFWVVGADTLITNLTIPLASFINVPEKIHFIIAAEWCGPMQADSFLVRNSKEGRDYIQYLIQKFDDYRNHPWVEQQAMIDSLHRYQKIIEILPQRSLNAYDYPLYFNMYASRKEIRECKDVFGHDGQWHPGDFLIHFAGLSMAHRVELVKKYLPLIQR